MTRLLLAAMALLLACNEPVSPAGDAVDAVKRVLRASASMNDSWLSTCLTAATEPDGKALCKKVHGIYADAIKASLK